MPGGEVFRSTRLANKPGFLKRFGMAGWETLTRGEASAILDREFAALDKERRAARPSTTRRRR